MNKNLLLVVTAVVFLLIGYGIGAVFSGNGLIGGGVLSKEDAKTEAQDFVNQYLMGESQEEAQVSDFSEEEGLYKMSFDVAGQSIDSYMTKDGKTFFPQAIDMENPGGDVSSEGDASAPQQQQMSPAEQAESMVSQGRGLLDQYGDSISEEDKQELEGKINELEELSGSEDPGDEELQSKMQEVQEASQPLIEKVTEEQQGQQGTGTTTQPSSE